MYTPALLSLLAAASVSAQLNRLAQDAGLEYFGTTVDNGYLSDEPFMAIANDVSEFGQLVPENGQKWDATEPSQGSFTYTNADVIPDLAKTNGQILRCHTLTWHSQLPSWVSSGSWTKAQLQAVIEAHIANVVGHFKGDCYAWDVVNEAAADDGSWRQSVFYQVMGTDYLPVSFNAARKADPDAKLYYNDYNLEYNGAKTDRTVEIVQIIQNASAPIDGVGFQGHLIVGSTPSRSSLVTALKRFTALGVEVAYTELDIRHSSVPASDAALVTQGNDYANVVGSCLDVEGCIGVTVWGFSDKYSWIPDTFSGAGEALLYDEDLNKKPAWTSVSSVLAAAATGAVSNSSAVKTVISATTAEATPTLSAVVSSADETTTPVYTPSPVVSTVATFQTPASSRLTWGGWNLTTQTTFETKTATAVASDDVIVSLPVVSLPSAPGSSLQYPSLVIPTVATTEAAAPTTHVPVVRQSTTAYSNPWINGTITTAVENLPSGTTPTPLPSGTDDEDEDCEEQVPQYHQCGGRNWTGATQCEKPFVCVRMNKYYSQCVRRSNGRQY